MIWWIVAILVFLLFIVYIYPVFILPAGRRNYPFHVGQRIQKVDEILTFVAVSNNAGSLHPNKLVGAEKDLHAIWQMQLREKPDDPSMVQHKDDCARLFELAYLKIKDLVRTGGEHSGEIAVDFESFHAEALDRSTEALRFRRFFAPMLTEEEVVVIRRDPQAYLEELEERRGQEELTRARQMFKIG